MTVKIDNTEPNVFPVMIEKIPGADRREVLAEVQIVAASTEDDFGDQN